MHCKHCNNSLESDKFYVLSAGALHITDYANKEATMFAESETTPFMTIIAHDHTLCNSEKGFIELSPDDWDGYGQFDYCFCSKECIKNWFMNHIDGLADIT